MKTRLYCVLRVNYTEKLSNAEVRARTGQEIVKNALAKQKIKRYVQLNILQD